MRKPCCDNKQSNNKGSWSKQEDQKLIDYIATHGESCWRSLPQAAGLRRCGKSCRLRWINYLRPDIKHGNFAQDEEDLIIKLHALLGNRWSLIAGRLPGRTDNEVKNYWNSHIRKKLVSVGIDPRNHRLNQIPYHSKAGHISSPETPLNITCKSQKSESDVDGISGYSTSCLEVETSGSSSLNLDLNIAVPSPSDDHLFNATSEKKLPDCGCPKKSLAESDPLPTLPLFR